MKYIQLIIQDIFPKYIINNLYKSNNNLYKSNNNLYKSNNNLYKSNNNLYKSNNKYYNCLCVSGSMCRQRL